MIPCSGSRESPPGTGNTVLRREYDYDKAGNIVSEQTGEGRHDYGYDPLDRLTKAENPTLPDEEYYYDAVGNRLSSADTNGTWSYNANNELLSYNNATCSFDENGNMVKRVINGQVTRYIYNANNRLIRVEDGSGGVIAKYYYDPFGRRLWKEVNGERTYFHYSEQGLIAEYDNHGDPIRFYGYKPGSSWTTDPLFLKKEGDYYFYHNDHLGTPQKLTASNGRVVWSAKYISFGGTQLAEQEIKNPLRFPGQYYDRETGLHYNYHRYYDPQVGRYLREDPIGIFLRDINLYVYCLNAPINFVDPKGLFKRLGYFKNPSEKYLKNLGDEADRRMSKFQSQTMKIGKCAVTCTINVVLGESGYGAGTIASKTWEQIGKYAIKKAKKECIETTTVKIGKKAIPYLGQASMIKDILQGSSCMLDCSRK